MTSPTLNEALESLRTVASRPHSVMELEREVEAIMGYGDSAAIGPLLLLLDDSAEYDEEMFSLVHAAESFADQIYMKEFLRVISVMQRQAPRWASIVLMRVINGEETRKLLIRELRSTPKDAKDAVGWLCEKINERSATFLEKTLPVSLAAHS